MSNPEKYIPEEYLKSSKEVPPSSEETLKKVEKKPEIPPLSKEAQEKLETKPKIPELSKEAREFLEAKVEIPPLPEKLRSPKPEWLEQKPEEEPLMTEAAATPSRASAPRRLLNVIGESAKYLAGGGAGIGGWVGRIALIGGAGVLLIPIGGLWLFWKGIKYTLKKSWETITGQKFEKKKE